MPPFYDQLCGSGRFLRLEYLYWSSGEPDLSYALTATAKPAEPESADTALFLSPVKYHQIGNRWDSGLRIGIGRHSSCDGWDSNLNWTYFRTKKTECSSVPTFGNPLIEPDGIFFPSAFQDVLINQWVNQSQTNLNIPLYFQQVDAEYKMYIHQLNLEMGRKYWLSQWFALRLFAGARALSTKTKFETVSSGTYGADTFSKYQDKLTNKTKAAGLISGMQPNFYLTPNFAVFGSFEGSLLWGRFTEKKAEQYSLDQNEPDFDLIYNHSFSSNEQRMLAGIDLQAGLRWEVCWCCDEFRTAIDLGWEQHILFDLNKRNKYRAQFDGINLGTGFESYDQVVSNLMLGGFIIRGQFDF